MKIRKINSVVRILTVVSFSLLIFTVFTKNAASSNPNQDLEIKVNSPKSSYILGEMVHLDFTIKNNSSVDIRNRGMDLRSGYLKVLIASEDGKFKEYNLSRSTCGIGIFKAGAERQFGEDILWNYIGFEEDQTRRFEENQIQTQYAFPTSGIYNIKAVLKIPSIDNPMKFESESIQIAIEEPSGDDLEFWNKIKDRGDIAYFMQEGEPRSADETKINELLNDIEQLINQQPNSRYVQALKKSQEKFRGIQERIKKQREDIQMRKQN